MEIILSDSYGPAELETRWRDLARRADSGFFLSWRWIGTWLRVTGAKPLLAAAVRQGETVGLGLLTPARKHRHFLSVAQLCLHETGLPAFDGVMIEHNNFLVARDAPPGLVTEIFRALRSGGPDWDEIALGGVSPAVIAAAEAAGLHVEIDRHSPDFAVDLAAPARWEDMLSPNQRAQLRQSRSFAERLGPLELTPAADGGQALEFFEQMAALHTATWQARNKPGAFAGEFSGRFHHELITAPAAGDDARVELLRLTAGSEVLGYLYNFEQGGVVHNYQSGFSYGQDNRHRPGLIAHAMAIARAQERGLRLYDFLAGEARYKARLGQAKGSMIWGRAQKNRPLLRGERAARRLVQGLRAVRRRD
ncbi:MAG TPA: GNAT family N-acetyltransferase [Rhizomicrobium sp.]|nr:GNAT family N-acetyltransferase [Rhizomicrobium sp.]